MSGTKRGTYSPMICGRSTANVSSISSSSIELRSTTQCRPLTGFAYGLEPGSVRNHVSVQPIRRPA